jgi:hypothetical protein
MKSKALFLFCVFLFLAGFCRAQVAYGPKDTIKVATTNYNGEIIPWIVSAPLNLKQIMTIIGD